MDESTQKLIFKVILASLKTILVNQKNHMVSSGWGDGALEDIDNMCELIDQVRPFCNQEPQLKDDPQKRVTLTVIPGF